MDLAAGHQRAEGEHGFSTLAHQAGAVEAQGLGHAVVDVFGIQAGILLAQAGQELGVGAAGGGVQATSARASIRGSSMYSALAGVVTYSVQRLPCTPNMCCCWAGVSSAGSGW